MTFNQEAPGLDTTELTERQTGWNLARQECRAPREDFAPRAGLKATKECPRSPWDFHAWPRRLSEHKRPAVPWSHPEDTVMSHVAAQQALTRAEGDELPLTVREAAKFLGVSPQTVYLWVERKQIPHLRVMGRNIRFLKSDLDSFRASFRQEMENG